MCTIDTFIAILSSKVRFILITSNTFFFLHRLLNFQLSVFLTLEINLTDISKTFYILLKTNTFNFNFNNLTPGAAMRGRRRWRFLAPSRPPVPVLPRLQPQHRAELHAVLGEAPAARRLVRFRQPRGKARRHPRQDRRSAGSFWQQRLRQVWDSRWG